MIPVPQPVLENLAQHFGTTAAQLHRFAGGREESDGVIYAYPFGNTRRLLKILAIPAREWETGLFCLDERLKFMRFLGERGARIAFPRRSPTGDLYQTASTQDHLWVGYTMDLAPGRTRGPRGWDPAFFRNWGQTIGLLHRLARDYPAWEASVDPATGQKHLTWSGEWQGFYDWCQEDDVKAKWLELRGHLEALPITRDVYGFIHNDPHLWNLLVEGDRIILLDFDVANHHWFANDIAIACQSFLFTQTGGMDRPLRDRERLLRFLDLFLEGYEREHNLSAEWLDRLDLFIAYRRILLFIVMHGGIRARPAAHAAWKNMIRSQPEVIGAYGARRG